MKPNKHKEFEKNSDLAFNLSVDMLKNYAEECTVNKDDNMIDPITGSYLLVHNLAIGLFFKAEGHEQELINVLHSAIEDAEYIVNNSREVN
jgi:hypothetical protein